MRKNVLNVAFFLVIASGFSFLFYYADKNWIPKPEKKAKGADSDAAKQAEAEARRLESEQAARSVVSAVAGAVAIGAEVARTEKPAPKPKDPPKAESPKNIRLIALGNSDFYNQVLLTTRGGAVQQVILPGFDAADRLGREVRRKDENGQPTRAAVPYHLIPGKALYQGRDLRAEYRVPDLAEGTVADPAGLAEPAFGLFHYATPDDKFPSTKLGEEDWKVVSEERPPGGEHKVVFEAELGDPYFVTIRKTYTLAPRDYHFNLRVEITKKNVPGAEKGKGQLRLQLSGPRMLPIEGEWYTTIYRVAIVGWTDRKGTPRRQYEDSSTVSVRRGGEAVPRGDNTFKYMAINTQYFASAVAIDETASGDTVEKNPWAFVRATTEVPFDKPSDPTMPFFDDLTVRAATDTIDLAPGASVVHSYVVYNGPAKVRLLEYLEGKRAVDPKLVERYRESLGLQTMTDFRSDTWLGRFASSIYWTDLVIAFTNLMHWLLATIHTVIPNWAMGIVVLTVMVRLLLFIPSRKQTQMNLKMMEVQKKLSPQIEELKKKFADDPQTFNREKMRLMMANGVNPFAAMGGCLLLIAQMPVMMGLYFCLGESVFFRLQDFLWVNNLAAPDMLIWWTEKIPFISTPEDMGSFLYLGPFFNALPLLAVGLMIWQQNKMMPPPTDEQMAQQQKMMKYMMIMVAVMFYKVAAGLALYFIIGSAWGILERKFIPKASDKKTDDPEGDVADVTARSGTGEAAAPKPKGFLGRMQEAVKKRMEEIREQADEQSKRQIRNNKGELDLSRDRKKKRRK